MTQFFLRLWRSLTDVYLHPCSVWSRAGAPSDRTPSLRRRSALAYLIVVACYVMLDFLLAVCGAILRPGLSLSDFSAGRVRSAILHEAAEILLFLLWAHVCVMLVLLVVGKTRADRSWDGTTRRRLRYLIPRWVLPWLLTFAVLWHIPAIATGLIPRHYYFLLTLLSSLLFFVFALVMLSVFFSRFVYGDNIGATRRSQSVLAVGYAVVCFAAYSGLWYLGAVVAGIVGAEWWRTLVRWTYPSFWQEHSLRFLWPWLPWV